MNFSEMSKARRAINFFDPEREVTDELVDKMIELGSRAPSGFNLQPWNLIILRDKEEKERLKALSWEQPKVVEAPVMMIVLADKRGWQEGHPTLEKNWKEMLASGAMQPGQRDWFIDAVRSLYDWSSEANLAFAAKNAGFFAMSLMYAAVEFGLETHPIDGFDHEGVRKEFNIPDNYWIPLLLAVGYRKPNLELKPPNWRKNLDEIVVKFH